MRVTDQRSAMRALLRGDLPRSSELREDIRTALKAAGVRPQPKECYKNAGRVVLEQSQIPLLYVAGIAVDSHTFIPPIKHAWIRTMDGVDHEITSRGLLPKRAVLVLTPKEVAHKVLATNWWGDWDWQETDKALNECLAEWMEQKR